MRSQSYTFCFSYAGMLAEVHVYDFGASVFYNDKWQYVDQLSGDFALAVFSARVRRG